MCVSVCVFTYVMCINNLLNVCVCFYRVKHVERANEEQAIETLLISDELFRAQDIAIRKRYVSLVDSVRENGGEVKIFSSLHVSGERE